MKKHYYYIIIVLFLILASIGSYLYFYKKDLRDGLPDFFAPAPQNIANIAPRYHTQEITYGANTIPLTIPKDFSISIFASDLGEPRVMAQGGIDDVLFVSITKQGKVIALEDADKDGDADNKYTVVENLNNPHGLAWLCSDECYLYIAESHQVGIYSYDPKTHTAEFKKAILKLPDGGRHFTRTIMPMSTPFGDSGTLFVSVGSSCDVCIESDDMRAAIINVNYDGTDPKIFAKGLRNAVFMAIHPVTGEVNRELWVTEMGRDELSDNLPPDEINILQENKNYGWPYCYGKQIHDDKFDPQGLKKEFCLQETAPSYIDIPAHSGPLGLGFFREESWAGFEEEYWYDLIVAYHGSWNRSVPTGYKIVRYKLDKDGNYQGEEDFITGWLTDDRKVLGRPVDILILPGGIIYITDDKAGVIYRVIYEKRNADAAESPKHELIRVSTPVPDTIIASPLNIKGEARGYWFFEALFPIRLQNAQGKEIAITHATALDEWMTENFVPFEADMVFEEPQTATGTLIFEKSNPSGLLEQADKLEVPLRFK